MRGIKEMWYMFAKGYSAFQQKEILNFFQCRLKETSHRNILTP